MLSIDFYSRLDEEQLPSFTQRLTVWQTWLAQSMWVTHSRMLCSLPRSCLVLPLDPFDSEGWFSSDQVIRLTVLHFLEKSMQQFKWKDAISGFPASPGSVEALVRCGGKIKYILIAYFLGNICDKNCRNRAVYVKIIASCKGGTFFETQCLPHGWHCQLVKYSKNISRYDSILLNRLQIGHSRLTHSYLLSGDDSPTCQSCGIPLTVKHILV